MCQASFYIFILHILTYLILQTLWGSIVLTLILQVRELGQEVKYLAQGVYVLSVEGSGFEYINHNRPSQY